MKELLILSCMSMGTVFVSLANTPPEITNVRASQRTGSKLVDIFYDAYDADNDSLLVRIQISDNDGRTFYLGTSSLIGDVGPGIQPGTDKHVVWNAGEDWDGEYSEAMRVRIGVTDMKRCNPVMEFGTEVMPGGFLMGADTASGEGEGASKRVVIPWNYRLGKYEVTEEQYCDFLNWALAAGYIEYKNNKILATTAMPWSKVCPAGTELSSGGTKWVVNSFYTYRTNNFPAQVNWYSAMAFARFFGYDLPTEAEWELAARGSEHDDLGEHEQYPWGNDSGISGYGYSIYFNNNCANNHSGPEPVGSYSNAYETVNELYDIIGNVAEWTRTRWLNDVTLYASVDSLTNNENNVFVNEKRTLRGYGGGTVTRANGDQLATTSVFQYSSWLNGFRVCVRPPDVTDSGMTETGGNSGVGGGSSGNGLLSTGVITFEDWPTRGNNQYGYISSNGYSWGLGYCWECIETSEWAYSGNKCLRGTGTGGGSGSGAFGEFKLPLTTYPVVEVRLKVGNFDGNKALLTLSSSVTGNSYSDVTKSIPAASGYISITVIPSISGKYNHMRASGNLYIDDIEVIYKVSE